MLRVSFSIVRLSAAWAADVMESASSSMTILNGGQGLPLVDKSIDFSKVNYITTKGKNRLNKPKKTSLMHKAQTGN